MLLRLIFYIFKIKFKASIDKDQLALISITQQVIIVVYHVNEINFLILFLLIFSRDCSNFY